jgi:hypothetical protein
MTDSERQQRYRKDALVLAEIGQVLARADLPSAVVRLPASLAKAALVAWQLDDESPLDPETYEQRLTRHRAATLGLIGLCVERSGKTEGDEVVVEVPLTLIGSALDAADDLPG